MYIEFVRHIMVKLAVLNTHQHPSIILTFHCYLKNLFTKALCDISHKRTTMSGHFSSVVRNVVRSQKH